MENPVEKKAFIEGNLSKTIHEATRGAVVSLRYMKLHDYDVVLIVFCDGYTREMRVVGESKWDCMTEIMGVINY